MFIFAKELLFAVLYITMDINLELPNPHLDSCTSHNNQKKRPIKINWQKSAVDYSFYIDKHYMLEHQVESAQSTRSQCGQCDWMHKVNQLMGTRQRMHNLRRHAQALMDEDYICLFSLQTVKLADVSRSWTRDLTNNCYSNGLFQDQTKQFLQ